MPEAEVQPESVVFTTFPAELRRFFVLYRRVGTTYLTAGGVVGIVCLLMRCLSARIGCRYIIRGPENRITLPIFSFIRGL